MFGGIHYLVFITFIYSFFMFFFASQERFLAQWLGTRKVKMASYVSVLFCLQKIAFMAGGFNNLVLPFR